METNLKKLLPIIGVVCFSMTTLSAAHYDDHDDHKEPRKMNSAVPPGVHGGEDSPCCFVSVDYTYWTARQAGLAVALAGNNTTASTTLTSKQGVIYPNTPANSGFKVGLGTFLNHDGWSLDAEYTWFSNQNKMKQVALDTAAAPRLVATWSTTPATGAKLSPQQVKAQWSNQFNRIDLELGRCWFGGNYMEIRTFCGLLGAWEDQNFDFEYHATPNVANPTRFFNEQNWWTVGPMGGCNATFHLPMNMESSQFSFFLNSSGGLPWGRYETTQKATTTAGLTTVLSHHGNDFYTIDPMLDMALGLRWETRYNEMHNFMFALSLAWEQQVWFGHNAIINNENATSANGNMSMQGLDLKAMFAF